MNGRTAEIARLNGILDGVEPDVRTIQLYGDPWIGKSELLGALADGADARGWSIAWGAASESSGTLPFGVFSDALHDLLTSSQFTLLEGFPQCHRSWLAGIYPALAQFAPEATMPTSQSELRHTFHAVRALLERLTSRPLLLVIDDLQWADQESIDLFTDLVRRAPAQRVLLATALRPRQLTEEVRATLEEALAAGHAARLDVGPLHADYLSTLLPESPGEHRQALLARADGNPGMLRALAAESASTVQTSVQRHPPVLGQLRHGHYPSGARMTLSREFRALSPDTWKVAQAAALLQDPLETRLLSIVAEQDEARTRCAVDELVRHDILRVDDCERTFRFRNQLLRDTVYQAAGAAWRLGAHGRGAAALWTDQAPPRLIAHHLEHCGRIGEDEAAILTDAAREIRWERPAQAVRWWRRALDAGGPADTEHLSMLATALLVTGHASEARRLFDEMPHSRAALGQQVTPSPESTVWASRASRAVGEHRAAEKLLLTGLRDIQPGDRRTRALLVAEGLVSAMEGDRPVVYLDPSIPWHTSAVRDSSELCLLAEQLDQAADVGTVALLLALAALTDADSTPHGAQTQLARAADLLAAVSDADLAPDLVALYWMARAESAIDRDERAREHLSRALRIAIRFGHSYIRERITSALHDLDEDLRHHEPDLTSIVSSDRIPVKTQEVPDADLVGVPSKLAKLSRRERDISRLVSDGRTNQQIARRLGLSHRTVETYLARIFRKLELCSRVQLATIVGRSAQSSDGPKRAATHPLDCLPQASNSR